MLTADLCRATIRKGSIFPRYIDPENPQLLAIAGQLIEVYAQHLEGEGKIEGDGPRRGELENSVALIVQEHTDPVLFRGLVKLLDDRCEFTMLSPHSPSQIREDLFKAAAGLQHRCQPGSRWAEKRQELLEQQAARLEITSAQLEQYLFADLDQNLHLSSFKTLSESELLERYNLALAQALLLRAVQLELELLDCEVGTSRQLFGALKFHQLIHQVYLEQAREGCIRVKLDGPLSLFSHSKRYGLAMAQILPTLILLPRWQLEAQILWGPSRKPLSFKLDHKRALKSHRKPRGQYVTAEQEWLEQRFFQKPGPWILERSTRIMTTQDNQVVIPDLVFTHTQHGKQRFLEIIGFWRKGSLSQRLNQLRDPALEDLIIAVSRNLAAERKPELNDHPRIVWFKNVIPRKAVEQALERETG